MPSSAVVHVAVFSVGAALGAGIAAGIASRKQTAVAASAYPPSSSAPMQVRGPLVETVRTGTQGVVQLSPTMPSDVLRYGNPGPISDLITRKAYVAGYDRRLRHPAWTAEHLTLASLSKTAGGEKGKGDRSQSAFAEDQSIPVPFRARMQDYFRSGYDRGHMVPAADAKISQEAMNETFLLSNIAPQVGVGFNRHYWAYTEDWCRRLTSNFQDVFVFTVPLYLPKQDPDGKYRVTYEVIGNPPNVAVPTHFAKVVLGSRPSSPATPHLSELSLGAFVLPNAEIPDETPLTKFVVPVDAVERAAGLALFSEEIKKSAKHICQTAKCEVIVRRFDDTQQQTRKAIAGPK